MRHRIFIAINLTDDIKERLLECQKKWPELPAHWTKIENLHITLLFLGYLAEEDLPLVLEKTKELALKQKPFSISLVKVVYGPPGKMPPRMIWAQGAGSKELGVLKEGLEKSLLEGGIKFSAEDRVFAPHITLARIKTWEWRKIEPEERPEVSEEINLSFEVNSIEVMESKLKRGGPEYFILESAPLKTAS